MKKITTLFAAAAMAVSASAQTVAESKTFDNVYRSEERRVGKEC